MTPDTARALERLRAGNRRFTSEGAGPAHAGASRRAELVAGQRPFAVVLGCSDSRVPPELLFDQGLGDLFVIRVAGNVVARSQLGSIEYAVSHLGARLVVVLGHSRCGAVAGALEERLGPARGAHSLRALIGRVRSLVATLVPARGERDPEARLRDAVRANVRAATRRLRRRSRLLRRLIAEDGLLVVGAEYSLESGLVDFFDGAPGPPPGA